MEAQSVPAASRTLDIFEIFAAEQRPLSLSELARLADIPVSTCHSLMRTLEQRGFLHFMSAREAYPTRKMLEVCAAIDAHDSIAAWLAPALTALRDETGETIILGSRQSDTVLYLLVVESQQTVRYTARVGEFKPLHSSAIGKTLLAEMPDDALNTWLSGRELKAVTAHTITSQRQLRRELAESRERGYFITHGENVADVMALAAPLLLGSMTLGVAIAGPLQRMQEMEKRHAPKLLRVVKALEKLRR